MGERGANLSEGERQIVCFVRALLSEPSLSMWTRQPRVVTVAHAAAAPIGQASFGPALSGAGVTGEVLHVDAGYNILGR